MNINNPEELKKYFEEFKELVTNKETVIKELPIQKKEVKNNNSLTFFK